MKIKSAHYKLAFKWLMNKTQQKITSNDIPPGRFLNEFGLFGN